MHELCKARFRAGAERQWRRGGFSPGAVDEALLPQTASDCLGFSHVLVELRIVGDDEAVACAAAVRSAESGYGAGEGGGILEWRTRRLTNAATEQVGRNVDGLHELSSSGGGDGSSASEIDCGVWVRA